MDKTKITLISAGAAFFLGVACIFYIAKVGLPELPTNLFTKKEPLEVYAKEVMEICARESYPPKCYDLEIPKLMDRGLTMEEGFQVTSLIQEKTNGYFFCHVLGHNLAAKETSKNPDDWTSVVARCPVGMCSNGCLHGSFQEKFRDESLTDDQIKDVTPQLQQICEQGGGRNFTGLEQASCYHALGHLSMYLTGADIKASTDLCNILAKKGTTDYTLTCFEGAYMQIFQPLEPEDFALVKDIAPTTTKEAEKYCDTFSGEYNAACHRESWPLYRDSLKESEGLSYFCSLVPGEAAIRRCYNAMIYVLTAQFEFDKARIVPLCEGLPLDRIGQCFANAASRHVETDYRLTPQAIELCKEADKNGVGDRCYRELLFYSSFNFHQDSEAFKTLCAALPEPWGTQCKNGEGKNTRPNQDEL